MGRAMSRDWRWKRGYVGRPKVPLIERGAALDAALKIIDQEGIDALSIRRLANELGVNGASLYHHFTNKETILVEATERALDRTPLVVLDVPSADWRSMMLSGATQLLDLLQSHPGLVPIIIKRRSMGFRVKVLDGVAQRLIDAGVPLGAITPMFDALERFVVGWVTRENTREPLTDISNPSRTPNLDAAAAAAEFTSRQLFDLCTIGIMNSIVQAAQAQAEAQAAEPDLPRVAQRVRKAPRKAAAG
jgi:AcrR family transcriptional regulator